MAPPRKPAQPCGLVRRLLIMLYDLLPVTAIVFIAALVALPVTGDRVRAGLDPLYTLYLFAAWFGYLGVCWTSAGKTLGMRAWKVEIVSDHGGRPDWTWSLVRFGAGFLSALPLGLGFLAGAVREDGRTWHDRLSRTRLRRIA